MLTDGEEATERDMTAWERVDDTVAMAVVKLGVAVIVLNVLVALDVVGAGKATLITVALELLCLTVVVRAIRGATRC